MSEGAKQRAHIPSQIGLKITTENWLDCVQMQLPVVL